MAILLTGAAGFVGYHVAEALLARGDVVLGVDEVNAYYDVGLKYARLDRLRAHGAFSFVKLDLAEAGALERALDGLEVDRIIHLAAQAGVRHSLVAPFDYTRANVTGHLAVLEAARERPGLRHLVYASSSSVYGDSQATPFREDAPLGRALSLYAATKQAGEAMAASYAHLFAIPTSGLRFFTVYGPWGRPDMAYFSFAQAILRGEPVTLFDDGRVRRGFTYIDDVVAGVLGCLDHPPDRGAPARLFNIGNTHSEPVSALVAALEESLGRRAVVKMAARPAADVERTEADVSALAMLCGFAPTTALAVGIERFARWLTVFMEIGVGAEKEVDRPAAPH